MKKIILLTTVFLLALESMFSIEFSLSFIKDKKSEANEIPFDAAEKLGQIALDFGVKEIKTPKTDSEYIDFESLKYFAKPSRKSTDTIQNSVEITQKNKKYNVEFYEDGNTVFYDKKAKFRVIDSENQVIQNGEISASEIPMYTFLDLNFDGFLDLVVIQKSNGKREDTVYSVYFWNNVKHCFSQDKLTYTNISLDKKHKFLIETEKTGANSVKYTYYEFRLGIRRFVASVSLDFDYKDETGSWALKIVFNQSDSKKDGDKGIYEFKLPLLENFNQMSDEQKDSVRTKYSKMAKLINAL